MRLIATSFSAALVCASSLSAFAQTQVDPTKFKSLLNSPAYVKQMAAVVSKYEVSVTGCKTPKVAGRVSTKLMKRPVAMPGIGLPGSAQWVDTLKIEGCGKAFQRKVIATLHQGRPIFFPYLAGTTRTTPKLQLDAMRQLLTKERTRSTQAGCKKNSPLTLSTTKFVAEAKVETGTMWREAWTVRNCKGKRVVGLLFSPDRTGKVKVSVE
ncbi:MAG: hypothetical protein AAF441_02550 [Pseudomonadota bacterium]